MINIPLDKEEIGTVLEGLYTLESEERESVHAAAEGLKRGGKQSLVDYYQKRLDVVARLIVKILGIKNA